MADLKNSKTISISNTGTFDFKLDDGSYTFDFTKNFVQVKLAGGQNTNLSDAAFAGAKSFDFTGVDQIKLEGINFREADASGKFGADVGLDAFVSGMLTEFGVSGTLDRLTVNGSKADAFKLVWDHLDNGYSYYNTPVNQSFVELGFEYLDYLNAGGKPLLDVTAKFTTDSDDAGTAPDRDQALHDNLLGNLDIPSIRDRFFDGNPVNNPDGTTHQGSSPVPNEALGNQIIDALTLIGWDRPYYSGNEGAANTAAQWDQAHHPEWFLA